jgi:hypothetical protein
VLAEALPPRQPARRHDDGGVWMTLGNGLADPILIVGAIGGEGSKGIGGQI